MRRILVGSFVVALLFKGSSTLAADELGTGVLAPTVATAAVGLVQHADLNMFTPKAPKPQPSRPTGLSALYVSAALLQGYDAYSTLTAVGSGGTEMNPVMKTVTKSPAVFVGIKAGVTAMSIMTAERMWKRHNRMGAMLTMVAANSVMAVVAAHNASVIARIR